MRIEKEIFKKKFVKDYAYVISDDVLANFGGDAKCLNELSELITCFIISVLSPPKCETPQEQLKKLNNIKRLKLRLTSSEISSLRDIERRFYALLHGDDYPEFISRQFKGHGIGAFSPKDYHDAIIKIFDNRLELIGNFVRNRFTNLDRYAPGSKENSSWQEKVKAENSQKHVKFASRIDERERNEPNL